MQTQIRRRRINSEDPDQTPHSAASDLGLHCLPMSQKWDDRLIWVNQGTFILRSEIQNSSTKFATISIADEKNLHLDYNMIINE